MTRPTNVEFITELMEFSNNGPLIQAYVLEALRIYSVDVIKHQDDIPEDGFVSRKAWVGCAEEVLAKMKERGNG